MEVTKWYVDCVDDAGEVCIAYWLRVATRALALTFVGTMLFRGGKLFTRNARASVAEPQVEGDLLQWKTDAIDVEMERRAPAVSASLLEDVVHWRCELPSADARVQVGDAVLRGRGYAEVLHVSGAPWKLPIEELRWGRFTGERSSLVWIEWRGPHPLTFVALDGEPVAEGSVGDELVSAGKRTLTLGRPTVIRDGCVGDALQGVPLLSRVLPQRFTATRERKLLGRGILSGDAAATDDGWCIYETVRFA